MADGTTGLHVKSLATETVRARLVDTGGTNEAAISAAGRLSVDGSGVTQPVSGTVTVSSISTSVTPGTAAANLGKAEDAAHASGDTGVFVLAVRNDGGAALAATDGDYIPFTTDNTGALRVTGGGGGTQYVEDVASAGAESLTLAGTIRQDTPASSTSADGDYANLKTDSVGRLWVNGSGVTQPVSIAATVTVDSELPAAAALADNFANPTAPAVGAFSMVWDGANWDRQPGTSVGTLMMGTAAHDAASAGNPLLEGGFASAAAPTDVSADGDAVRAWYLRNGSQVVNLASGGTLLTIGQKTMANSFPVVFASDQSALTVSSISTSVTPGTAAANLGKAEDAAHTSGDVGVMALAVRNDAGTALAATDLDYLPLTTDNTGALRVTGGGGGTQYVEDTASAGAESMTLAGTIRQDTPAGSTSADGDYANMKTDAVGRLWVNNSGVTQPTNIAQAGGVNISATAFLPTRLTDGSAYYSNTGQTAGTAHFSRITDATNTAAVIATINALKTDTSSIAGAVPSATNALPVRLTDGSAFYAAGSGAPTSPQFDTETSANLGTGASVDLDFTAISGGTTGHLMGVDVSAAVPLKVEIKTVNAGTPTTRVVLFTQNGDHLAWRPPFKTFVTQAGGATSRFRVTVTNRDNAQSSDVYATGYWDQI